MRQLTGAEQLTDEGLRIEIERLHDSITQHNRTDPQLTDWGDMLLEVAKARLKDQPDILTKIDQIRARAGRAPIAIANMRK